MRTRLKICGLRSPEAVAACTQAGADAVGFVFYPPSPRAVAPAQAAALALSMGPWQTPVALFVNPEPALVAEVLLHLPHALLQFHGDETPEFCEHFSRPYIKAVRMKPGVDLQQTSQAYASAQGLLVDSWSEAYGGSGHTFDWSLLPALQNLAQPLVLSGGLDAGNVGEAVLRVGPYGVDVSSGVESDPGIKCPSKIKAFCEAVQRADFFRLRR